MAEVSGGNRTADDGLILTVNREDEARAWIGRAYRLRQLLRFHSYRSKKKRKRSSADQELMLLLFHRMNEAIFNARQIARSNQPLK